MISANAFAAVGGACPTGANYLNPATNALTTLSSLGVTGCFYISATGADTNNGTSESTPWLHAPGMANCASNCNIAPAAGQGFIFHGGDTWHMGNSSATPYTGSTASCGPNTGTCGWLIQWSGSSGNPIYWGVDQTWYSGSSWARPILTGDNPTSTSAVASCAYDQSKMNFIHLGATSYNLLDNFEMTGLCWHGNQSSGNEAMCCSGYVVGGAETDNNYSNLYIHGWTHVTFSCSETGGEPTGNCDGTFALSVAPTSGKITHIICDGSDADGVSLGCMLWSCYDVEYSVLRYASQGAVCNGAHIWHDNWIDHISQSGDGQSHSNAVEFPINEATGNNYFYNNVISNNFVSGSGVTTWFVSNATDYYFNNVWWNNPGGQVDFCQTTGQCAGAGGVSYWYNNTIADSSTLGTGGSWSGTLTNNLLINTSILGTPTASVNTISMTDAQATTAGITSGSAPPYQTTSSTCNGHSSPTCPVGAGTNLTSSWPSGYSTNDTTYACTYSTSTHSVTCPARTAVARSASGAWDVGAFQYAASNRPNPPTNVIKTSQQ